MIPHRLKNQIAQSNRLLKIINFSYRLKNRKYFLRRIEENRQTDIFNFELISSTIPYYPTELVIDNNFYGLGYVFKKYAGIDVNKSLSAYIEHGLFLGDFVKPDQYLWNMHSVITLGNQRVKTLQNAKVNKQILPVGPYIHYANSLLDESEMIKLKSVLKRTLLVFPSHSVPGLQASFDIHVLIEEIERIRKDFDTVLISLYWKDIIQNPQYIAVYQGKGYKIVTSGFRFDIDFLPRQRSLIELSDFTMSNDMGTHVGYCIYLNKPHYIFDQTITNVAQNILYKKHYENKSQAVLLAEEQEVNEIKNYFTEYVSVITAEQRAVVEKYWGPSNIKTPDELRQMLSVIS